MLQSAFSMLCNPFWYAGVYQLQLGLIHSLQSLLESIWLDVCPPWAVDPLQGHILALVSLMSCSSFGEGCLLYHWTPLSPLPLLFPVVSHTLFLLPLSIWHFLSLFTCFNRACTSLVNSALAFGGSAAELSGNSCVQHKASPVLFSQKPPLQHTWYQNLPIYTWYKGHKSVDWE